MYISLNFINTYFNYNFFFINQKLTECNQSLLNFNMFFLVLN